MSRLTPAGKVVIALVILLPAVWFAYTHRGGTTIGGTKGQISKTDFTLPTGSDSATPVSAPAPGPVSLPSSAAPLDRPIRVGINVWGGYAPGLVANGGKKTAPDSINARRGLQVDYTIIDDWNQKGIAFWSGKLDIVGTTADNFASQRVNWAQHDVISKAFVLHDWSRGGDGIVSTKAIKSIEDLKGKKVATTQYTPSHFLLLYLLYNSGLTPDDIQAVRQQITYTDTAGLAAKAFVAHQVDAAVTWEPDLSNAARNGGGHILASTSSVSNLIADVLVANDKFLRQHPSEVEKYVETWLEGVKQIRRDPEGSARLVADALNVPVDDVKGMLSGLRLTELGDNSAFFGLDPAHPGQFQNLFKSASTIWRKETLIDTVAEPEDSMDSRFVAKLAASAPKTQLARKEFTFTQPKKQAQPLLKRRATIHFSSDSAAIQADSRYILDDMAKVMMSAGNAYLRVEGNTSGSGNAAVNKMLSLKRAAACRDYMVAKYGLEPKRFQVVGNGFNKPMVPNTTESGRERNRRTDLILIPNA
ncbi:MAG TPA: phosphate ABC transporter substrate-binding/OmpA family protein [Armatimonadota bacterium]|jgi:NitT/TauT family transport system substrate-binding protein